uniref:D-aminoacyl-tRNA deacylase n=1 Tax=Lepeophtheirus salmonis TaxID=72036 RepID=D3PHX8_LEPSM|nr:D-tyrosyl-tRNATyr deacylase 1 [Lepeophtheirus salmonis]
MKLLIQRVNKASVSVDGTQISSIGKGLCVMVGIHRDDAQGDAEYLQRKLTNIRLFENEENDKKWDKSVLDMKLEVLLVSQFTLCQELKGNKPDFRKSMGADKSKSFYDSFVSSVKEAIGEDKVKEGQFGAHMIVDITNDGPVTIEISSKNNREKS